MKRYRLKDIQSADEAQEYTPCNRCCFDVEGVCTKLPHIKDIKGRDCVDEDAIGAYFLEIIPRVRKKPRKRRKLSKDAIAFILSKEGLAMSSRALGDKFDVGHGVVLRIKKNFRNKQG